MLKQDRFITGTAIGIALPAVLYTIFWLAMEIAGIYISRRLNENMILFLIGINAVLMRHFMVKRQQDNIGKGILLVTFIFALSYAFYYYSDLF